MFEKIKAYYGSGAWSIGRVYDAVGRWITEKEYEEITGKRYR